MFAKIARRSVNTLSLRPYQITGRRLSQNSEQKSSVYYAKSPSMEPELSEAEMEALRRMPPPPAARENVNFIDAMPTSFFVGIFIASISFAYIYNSMMSVKSPAYEFMTSTLRSNTDPENFRKIIINLANKQYLPLDLDKDERAMPRPFFHSRAPNPIGFTGVDVDGQGVVALMKMGAALIEVGPVTMHPSGVHAATPAAAADGSSPNSKPVSPVASTWQWGHKVTYKTLETVFGDVVEELHSPLAYSSVGAQRLVQNLREAVRLQAEDPIARHSSIGVVCAPETTDDWVSSIVSVAKATALFADYLVLDVPACLDRSEEKVVDLLQQVQKFVCALQRDQDPHRPPVMLRLPADADDAFVDLCVRLLSMPADVPEGSEPVPLSITTSGKKPSNLSVAPPAPAPQRMLLQGISICQERDVAVRRAAQAVSQTGSASVPTVVGKSAHAEVKKMVTRVWPQVPEWAKQNVHAQGSGVSTGHDAMELINEGAAFVLADRASLGYGGLAVVRTIKDLISTQLIVKAYITSMHAVGDAHALRKEQEKERRAIKEGKMAKPSFGKDAEVAVLKTGPLA